MASNRLFIAIIAVLIMLSISLLGQEEKKSPLSYSLSYIPPYLYSSKGDFEFLDIYSNIEANIHYKPYDRISFSTGLGYFRKKETIPSYIINQLNEFNISVHEPMSNFRMPLQVNYHIIKYPKKTDSYIKATFVNSLSINRAFITLSDGSSRSSRSSTYVSLVGLGIGTMLLHHKSVGILLEATVEKSLQYNSFSSLTNYSLKLGIVI